MSFLTTAIKGLPFLGRSSIHIDHFDIDEVLKEKWLQIANVDNFTSLGITYNNEEVKVFQQPPCYYAQVELIKSTLELIHAKQEN